MRTLLLISLLSACASVDAEAERRAAFEALLVQAEAPEICTAFGRSVFVLEHDGDRMVAHVDGSVGEDVAHDLQADVSLFLPAGTAWSGGCGESSLAFELPEGDEVVPVEHGLIVWQVVDDGALDTVELDVELRFVALDDIMPLRARAWTGVTALREIPE